ncbi:MAG: M28 family peptidase [Ignavibacteria bacterium]|nr:M28 family peptidase [Ignavibacteria bacterium]MBI3766271.1 M28 family peptidase [Ignavibacteriales bacterium]
MQYRLVFLLTTFFLLSCGKDHSDPKAQPTQHSAKSQIVPAFDGMRAFQFLTAQTDFGPRTPGSVAHQRCLTYLQTEMAMYAEAVNQQQFSHVGYRGELLNMTNLISSFNLKATSRILLIAHWDSRPMADQEADPLKKKKPILGANDGASGVAVLMEISRHLKEDPPSIGVDMLFVDGEDFGKESDTKNYLLGARYFAKHLPPGFKPLFGILLDMVGDRQLEIEKEPYSLQYAPDIVELVWSTAKQLGVEQFISSNQRYVIDDHLPLNEVGIKTIDLIDFNYPDDSNRFWHTTEDTPDKCSPESLEAVGKVLMYVIYQQPAQ